MKDIKTFIDIGNRGFVIVAKGESQAYYFALKERNRLKLPPPNMEEIFETP